MILKIFHLLFIATAVFGEVESISKNTVFDHELYEEVLNPQLCQEQISYLRNHALLAIRFADAGIRIPRGILSGNLVDLGNYHQCLGINEIADHFEIQGKYCKINVPVNQSFALSMDSSSEIPELMHLNPESLILNEEVTKLIYDYNRLTEKTKTFAGIDTRKSPLPEVTFSLAVCIPKPCSTQQAITSFLFNNSAIGFEYEDSFCRLPDDKPWVAADYVTIAILSIIGVITILCTCFDLHQTMILKKAPSDINTLCRSFSIYTNGRRLMTFTSNPESLHCLDGIRTLAMLWIITGHSFLAENIIANPLDSLEWSLSYKSIWITLAPYSVDTFFVISGTLLVYTVAGKVSNRNFIKKLHLFYLNRYIRLFPILALMVLLQTSVVNRAADGPVWTAVASQTQACRENWWATLLHIQNYATVGNICLGHSWYIAIDFQLYVISPLILFWVLSGSKRAAWIALTTAALVCHASATTFNLIRGFPSDSANVTEEEWRNYMDNYYINTLTRAGPFFVGMILGYVLFIWKGQKPKIPLPVALFLWACTFTVFSLIYHSKNVITRFDWDNQAADIMINSFSRSGWAAGLGWLIFACVHGYAGPINWFLTLDIWKLPSRISYAMYLLHFPFMFSINGTQVTPIYFTVGSFFFKYMAHLMFTIIISFLATLLIDGPFTVLFKLMIGDGVKKQRPPVIDQKVTGEFDTK